jgi:hypothetical protein
MVLPLPLGWLILANRTPMKTAWGRGKAPAIRCSVLPGRLVVVVVVVRVRLPSTHLQQQAVDAVQPH